jgi:AraC-like DNA-binding protein
VDNCLYFTKITFLESKGTFVTVKPKDTLVSRYIAYYYFHHSDQASFKSNFFFYPNYNHALTVYKGSDVSLTEEGSVILPSVEDNISTFYSINTSRNFKVSLNGAFNKIGVVFNPLGINHFMSLSLSETLGNAIFRFEHFGEAFNVVLHNVYDQRDPEQKALLLDAFFAENYKGFNEPVVKAAVSKILNSNGSVRVEELSGELQVNRKTLLRFFKKHLCCSVEEYKKLVMFRNALNYSQQHKDEASLTDVALYSLYYDQAHFIKHFKSVTKLPPKTLLSNLTHLGSQGVVYWHFED